MSLICFAHLHSLIIYKVVPKLHQCSSLSSEWCLSIARSHYQTLLSKRLGFCGQLFLKRNLIYNVIWNSSMRRNTCSACSKGTVQKNCNGPKSKPLRTRYRLCMPAFTPYTKWIPPPSRQKKFFIVTHSLFGFNKI